MRNPFKMSREKLNAAGYKFLRAADHYQPKEGTTVPCIKVAEKDDVWQIYGKYATKKERDIVMHDLVQDEKSPYIVLD